SGARDGVLGRRQARERAADEGHPEIVGLLAVDDDPCPRLRLDREPLVARLPATAAKPFEGGVVRIDRGLRGPCHDGTIPPRPGQGSNARKTPSVSRGAGTTATMAVRSIGPKMWG